MTKEEIIEMAKQCSFTRNWEYEKCLVCNPDSLYHFAKLVAEKEREKFCAVLRQLHDSYSLTSDSNAIRARGDSK